MKTCPKCGKKVTGRANKIYCGGACKKAANRSRKKQEKQTAANTMTDGERKDLSYIQRFSPEAVDKLEAIFHMHGKTVFFLALEAVYIAVVDTQPVPA